MGTVTRLKTKTSTDVAMFVEAVRTFADAINKTDGYKLKQMMVHPEAGDAVSQLRTASRKLSKLAPSKFPELKE